MNWRSKARVLDWAVPLGFGLVLCLMVPLRTALEFGGDEGYELTDRIVLTVTEQEQDLVEAHGDWIKREVLATEIGVGDSLAIAKR